MRGSGILLPVFSLAGNYGIGGFSSEAYEFVDFLVKAGQRYWQVLPFGPTGAGNSPYQTFCSFAGNPLFIGVDGLVENGLLKKNEVKRFEYESIPSRVDYGKIITHRRRLFRKAYERFDTKSEAFRKFVSEQEEWLSDYCLFMSLKNVHEGVWFGAWEKKYVVRETDALQTFMNNHKEELYYYAFLQFIFEEQWQKLKQYANNRGISIIGDIPIYVSMDSTDVWTKPELFSLTEEMEAKLVAGCPPDGFSRKGQLWGNPVYLWENHKAQHFSWWIARIRRCFEWYDVLRIDHFRGFDEFYTIPAGNETAEYGQWMKGPGMELFYAIRDELGDIRVIAEDLGQITDGVKQLVADSGFPGMRILEFAFYPSDGMNEGANGTSNYLPFNYEKNCVVYTGTHDNETLMGWLGSLGKRLRKKVLNYLWLPEQIPDEVIAGELIRNAEASVADYCIIPMQDFLKLDNRARINVPGTDGDNWTWRMEPKAATNILAKSIRKMMTTYGRI